MQNRIAFTVYTVIKEEKEITYEFTYSNRTYTRIWRQSDF